MRVAIGLVVACLGIAEGGCLSPGTRVVETAGSTSTSGGETFGMSSTSQASTTTSTTSEASSASTTSEASTTTTAGCSFLDCHDGGPSIDACDLFIDYCPRGMKCNIYSDDGGNWNANGCFPLDPDPVPPGAPCTVVGNGVSGLDDCEAGATCWDVDFETHEGYCLGFCDGTYDAPTCAEPGTHCYLRLTLALCLVNCSPLGGLICNDGDSCVPKPGDGYACVPDQSGDAGAYGDPCEAHNECDPGLFCLPQASVPKCGSPSCCTPVCDLNEPESCPFAPDHQCVAWYDQPEDIPPGLGNVGVCVIPP